MEWTERAEKCPLCKKTELKVKLYDEGDVFIKCFACKSTWLLPNASEVDRILDEAAYEEEDL